jgi:periplasmic divalent cation tolerance protein
MEYALVYMTAPTDAEAARIGRDLVDRRLAACANLLPGMVSLYWWENNVERADEVVLIAKTRTELVPALTERVREIHPYQTPCIVSIPLQSGNPDYLNWIASETQPKVPQQ